MNNTITHLDCDTLVNKNENVQDCVNSVLAFFSDMQIDVRNLEEDVHCEFSTHINLDNSDDIVAVDAEAVHERVCVNAAPRIRLRDVLLQNTYSVVSTLITEGIKVLKVAGVYTLNIVLKADTYLENLYVQTKEKHQECKNYFEKSFSEATGEDERNKAIPTTRTEQEKVYAVHKLPVERVGSGIQVAYVKELPSKLRHREKNSTFEREKEATFIEMIFFTCRNFIFILRTGRTLT